MEKRKRFIILRTWSNNKLLGTTHKWRQLVRCPECGKEFIQNCSSGCFHTTKSPSFCPACSFPWKNLTKRKTENKTETFNPSKRET